jgi:hypothetical protein
MSCIVRYERTIRPIQDIYHLIRISFEPSGYTGKMLVKFGVIIGLLFKCIAGYLTQNKPDISLTLCTSREEAVTKPCQTISLT